MIGPIDHLRNPLRRAIDEQTMIVAEIDAEYRAARLIAARGLKAESTRQRTKNCVKVLAGAPFGKGKSLWRDDEHDFGR